MKNERMGVYGAAILAAALAAACVDQPSRTTRDQSEDVAKFIKAAPPAKIEHRLDADLDGKIVLLGYDVDRAEADPGDSVRVTWYWQVKEAPGSGWRLFTHLMDDKGRSKANRDRAGEIRVHYQPEHWRVGQFIEDIQVVKIPNKWSSPEAELRVGLFKGKERMTIRNGPDKGESRARGPRIKIGKPVEVVLPSINVPFVTKPPVIDGAFENEEAWKDAAHIDAFVETLSGAPAKRATKVLAMWDKEKLYLAVKADDDFLQSKYTKHDEELWHEDAFEMMLDPGEPNKDYFEIQTSPAGIVFDSYLPSYRKNQNEWESGLVVKVKLDGKLNDPAGEDKGWIAEMALPFASLKAGGTMPPANGEKWRANFFRVDATKDKPLYSAWSAPMRGDFHALDRFGTLVFVGGPEAKPEAKLEKAKPETAPKAKP
ncbi:MAG: carbohydrate-binding family 9-like protein [Deltaproteobacteria bacterium]|nr:carbohydrate-binding family 9-like protein [Deltaproteobacteria bacterium]